jgi:hypothetical protein
MENPVDQRPLHERSCFVGWTVVVLDRAPAVIGIFSVLALAVIALVYAIKGDQHPPSPVLEGLLAVATGAIGYYFGQQNR